MPDIPQYYRIITIKRGYASRFTVRKINGMQFKRLMIQRRLIDSFVRTLYHISRDETIIIRDTAVIQLHLSTSQQ